MKHLEIGKIGEEIAYKFIKSIGFAVLDRNYKILPYGEIDIVSRYHDGTIVFFEVKTLVKNREDSIDPEDNMTKSKIEKLKKACTMFRAKHQKIIDDKKGWRIDLISISIPYGIGEQELLTNYDKHCIIRHYEGVS